MKNVLLFIALFITATAFGQIVNVPSNVTTDIVSADVSGSKIAVLTTDGKLLLSTDGGATFNLTTFSTAGTNFGAFTGKSVSFSADGSIGIFGNQLHKAFKDPAQVSKAVIYKANANGVMTHRTVGTSGSVMKGGIMNGVNAIVSATPPGGTSGGHMQSYSPTLTGGGTYVNLRGYTPTNISGNSCPGSIVEDPINLATDVSGNVTGVSKAQQRIMKYTSYLATTPSGAIVTIKEGKFSSAVINAIDITSGAFNLVLSTDGRIWSKDAAEDNCDPYTLLTTAPSSSCNKLAYDGTKFLVGANGSIMKYSGSWVSNPTPGVNISDVVVCNGVGFAFGTGGKIFKVTL